MTFKILTMTTAALGLFLTIGATTIAHAGTESFSGTRDQVRAVCSNAGGHLIEGNGYSACFDQKHRTSVSCDEDGWCEGMGPRLADFGFVPRRNHLDMLPAASISESSGGDIVPRSTLSGTPSGGPVLGGGHIGNGNR